MSDQVLENKLLSAITSPNKKKKPDPIDPSKNFMAKNMEKIAELQKVKEQEKLLQELEVNVYSPPKKTKVEKV
jgi:dihydroorotate dehydrogenase